MKLINQFKKRLNRPDAYVYFIAVVLFFQLFDFSIGSLSLGLFSAFCLLNATFSKPKLNTQLLFPIIYFLVIVVSLLLSYDKETFFLKVQQSLPFLFVPISFAYINYKSRVAVEKTFKVLANALSIYVVILGIYAFFRYQFSQDSSVFFYHEFSSLFDVNAIYLSSALFLSFVFLIDYKDKSRFDYLSLILIFLAIILLSSKLIIFLLISVSFYHGIVNLKSQKLKISFVFLTIIFSLFLIKNTKIGDRINLEYKSNYQEVLTSDKFSKTYLWTGSSIRLFQGRVFWELLQRDKKYFFGYGFNSSQERIKSKHIQYDLYPGFYNYNFHNQYLQTTAELGLIGLFTLGIMFYSFFSYALKSKLLWPLMIGISFLILFLTESYLVRQRGIVYFLFYYCVIINQVNRK